MRLWLGQAVSEFGSVVTRDALPLVAVLTLQATPAQMGLLAALGMLPAFLIGLPAGAWVDRRRRRPIMIASDLTRAALLASIPAAFVLGALRIEQLYVVALLAGALDILFDTAYQSYLPSLVERENLVEGNSKLGATESIAEIGGSALAGALVQILSAPMTILIDAVSFLASVISVALIRKPEARPQPSGPPNLRQEIVAGIGFVARQPLLRALVGAMATRAFFGNFYAALYSLYALRELNLTPAILGLLIASGGLGSLFGALLTQRAARRFGLGRALVGGMLVSELLGLLTPLAGGPLWLAAAMLWVPQFFGDASSTVFSIHATSLRQTITPDHLLGRMNATINFVLGSVATVGVLVGGLLGDVLGLRPAVWIAALGSGLAVAWLIASPLGSLHGMPQARVHE